MTTPAGPPTKHPLALMSWPPIDRAARTARTFLSNSASSSSARPANVIG
jgi:hypothetical protein